MPLLRTLLHALLPARCAGCERALDPTWPRFRLCLRCERAVPPPLPPLCRRCGDRLGSAPIAGDTCPACRRHPPAFATARAAAFYEPGDPPPPLVAAIHAFKYGGARGIAPVLATLMAERVPLPRSCLVVPVPLHPARLRRRGYNQAALLARHLARLAGQPLAVRVLARRVAAAPQTGLGGGQRRRNLLDAFVVREPAAVAAAHVLLVDDVVTTGATADACARALLHAGARRVDVVAAGRTAARP